MSEPVTLLVHSDTPEVFSKRIEARFPDIAIHTCGEYGQLEAALWEVAPDIVMSHKFEKGRYPGHAITACESVRWVHVGGAGIDHLLPWDPARLTVTNSAGTGGTIMAEFALWAVYSLNLNFPLFFHQQKNREWRKKDVWVSKGGTMCVVGLGQIGQAIAERARVVGIAVTGVRRSGAAVPGVGRVHTPDDIEAALGDADYIVVTLPRTPETMGLIDAHAFAAMKPGAIFVNLSRGGIVEEAPLLDALQSGRLRGAALDVFAAEPLPAESPFWGLENVIITPHVAGFYEGWREPVADLFAENLACWLDGRPLRNVVDPETGY